MSCLCGGDSYAERKALKESSCTISCRGEVGGGKKQSIMITLPNGKTVTFFEDGWCNPNDKKNSIRKEKRMYVARLCRKSQLQESL